MNEKLYLKSITFLREDHNSEVLEDGIIQKTIANPSGKLSEIALLELKNSNGDPSPQELPKPFQEPSIKPIQPEISPIQQPPIKPNPIEISPFKEPGEKPIPEELPPTEPLKKPLPKEVPPIKEPTPEKEPPEEVPPKKDPTPEKEPPEEAPPVEEPPTKEPVDHQS